jgi:hypothetical protein
MKRDWDVVRKILLKVEELSPGEWLRSDDHEVHGIDNATAGFHMVLLKEAGFVAGSCLDTGQGHICNISRLTWQGQEFLDSIKKDARWEKVKETAQAKGIDLTIDTIKAIVKGIIGTIF